MQYPVKRVIWDWNGTLLDDTRLCYEIANRMRAERGMPLMRSEDEYRAAFGFPVIDYYRRMGYTFEQESYEDISVEFVGLFAENLMTCSLQPHAAEVLAKIQRQGVPQTLLSATGADRLSAQAEAFSVAQYFDSIIGGENNLAHGKAEQARAFLEKSGVHPKEALFIGDTDHDYEVSAAVGCRCVLLTRGHHTRAHLSGLGVPLIDDLSEVLSYIDRPETADAAR